MRRTVMIAAAAGLATGACAQSRVWDGGAGTLDWFDGANWNPDGVPTDTDDVLLQAGGVVFAQGMLVEAFSVDALSGLLLDSSDLQLAGPSRIVGLGIRGCCLADVGTSSPLTIEGGSLFERGARFFGAGSVDIAGTLTAQDTIVVEVPSLVVSGELVTDAAVRTQPSATASIAGTLRLLDGGLIEGSGPYTNTGSVGVTGTDGTQVAALAATMTSVGGRLFAEGARFDLGGTYPCSGTVFEATDGGEVFLGGSGAFPIDAVRFTGDARVRTRNRNLVYTGAITSEIEFPGELEIENEMKLDGTLTNTGVVRLDNSTVSSPAGTGSIVTSGFVDACGIARLAVPVTVRSGGTIGVYGPLTVDRDVDVEAGGVLGYYSDDASISRGSGAEISVGGRLLVDDVFDDDPPPVGCDPAVNLLPGGRIDVRSGVLQLRGGGVWSGGEVVITGNPLSGVTLLGAGVTHLITGDVLVNAGAGAWFETKGASHTLDVRGSITIESDGFVGAGFGSPTRGSGSIVNLGGMSFSNVMEPDVLNQGTLSLPRSGLPTIEGTLRNDASVIQYGDAFYPSGTVLNNGTWVIENAGGADQLVSPGGVFTNEDTYFVGVADHDVGVRFDNRGVVLVGSAAQAYFYDCAQVLGGALTGGTWLCQPGGGSVIDFPGQTIGSITGAGTTVAGGSGCFPWLSAVGEIGAGAQVSLDESTTFDQPVTVRGTLTIESGSAAAPGASVEGGGVLELNDNSLLRASDGLDVDPTAVVKKCLCLALLPGTATIEAGTVSCEGTIIPGNDEEAGRFDIVGDLELGSAANAVFGLGGGADRINVSGAATLDGTVRVHLRDGYEPGGGESHTLISAAGGVFGQFGTENLPPLPDGLEWDVGYTGTEVILSVTGGGCTGDWNGDGTVNTLDFLAFLNDWSGGDPDADLNGDGTVNTLDFLAFLNAWTDGC